MKDLRHGLVAFSKKSLTARSMNFRPKLRYAAQEPQSKQPFIPFPQFRQQKKQLQFRLVSVLHGCHDLTQLKQVHGHLLRKGLDQCCYVLTKLLRMLTKIGVPMEPYPRLLFEQVNQRNPFLWTAFIRGYISQGASSKSFLLYDCMRRDGTGPVSFTFTALLKVCTAALDVNVGTQLHAQAISVGASTCDLYVGNTLIDMYVKCGFLDCGRRVFGEMLERDVISWTTLIGAYAKSGDMEAAAGLFYGLPMKDMVAWTAMVTGYAQNAYPGEALKLFGQMQDAGVETDDVTLIGVISACAQLGAPRYARWVQSIAKQSGFEPTTNVTIGSALIDMHSKCGSLDDAYKVFMNMNEKNVFSYSSMILAFAVHGCPTAALKLYHEMIKETNIKPNKITFIGVLTACSHAGMVAEGRHVFATMEECYDVAPTEDHYTCMVDLLGRAGRLEEALELVKMMSLKPHVGVWGALLGACRIHENPDIAEIAAAHLFELEPYEAGNHVLLSNIYASAGRWNDVSRVRKLMRMKGLQKIPACSWLEGKRGEIHRFVAGDNMTHPRSSEIRQALEDLIDRLKVHGYRPNLRSVVYDVTDDVKKQILMGHSEKLALAFGLVSTNAGSKLMIAKNVRICEDCHLFMCGASGISGREIIVRDNMRFHHFRNGKCSCGNFW